MITIFTLALITGFLHALEADHMAAVSSLFAAETKKRQVIQHGVSWALGHAVTLLAVCLVAIFFAAIIPENFSAFLELIVGVMLVALALQLFWRLKTNRVHFHIHQHESGKQHLHVHAHPELLSTIKPDYSFAEVPHQHVPHQHSHSLNFKSLYVGIMHGLAGSAALLVVAVSEMQTQSEAVLYVLVFSLGSILGMAVVSALMSVPLAYSAKFFGRINFFTQSVIGVVTFGIGLRIVWNYWA